LVNLLMQATTLQPNLPIFPANFVTRPPMQAYLPPQATQPARHSHTNTANTFTRTATNFHAHPPPQYPPSATSGLFSRAEAHPNAPMNFIRKITPGGQSFNATSPSARQSPTFSKTSSAPPTLPPQLGPGAFEVDVADSRESTPASPPYPKAGNGLMAKLGPDDQDMEWLEDPNDFGAFSHVLYAENGVEGRPQVCCPSLRESTQ
jgi:hypothetical protein